MVLEFEIGNAPDELQEFDKLDLIVLYRTIFVFHFDRHFGKNEGCCQANSRNFETSSVVENDFDQVVDRKKLAAGGGLRCYFSLSRLKVLIQGFE